VSTREATLERLRTESFDVLVIGGGIVGAGVAALAAETGLAVALVDRADFASATSSASSKLIHGGLRYLRMGDFKLVHEALGEGQALLSIVAPHLVQRLQFVLPVYDDGPYGKTAIRSALWLYRSLAGARVGGSIVPGAEAAALVPALRLEGLRTAGLYVDAETNDARLCLANVRAAAERGAAVLNYAEVVSFDEGAAEVEDRVGGGVFAVRARAVVNATGPWVDRVRRLEDRNAGTSVTLSKGAHLVLDPPEGWKAALTIPIDKARVSFAIPWQGMLLLGTTDESFEAEPEELEATADDETQILTEAGKGILEDAIPPSAVRARFAGLRVLPTARRGTARAHREVTVTVGPRGMVTVAGGKLTTYRRIAATVFDALRPQLGLRRWDDSPSPLPGAADPEAVAESLQRSLPGVEPDVARSLAHSYGSLAGDVVRPTGPLEALVPGQPELAAQVVYARDHEWAVTADDVLRRRTTLALRGFDSAELRARVEELLAS
jgi:glycerol-3-phosphate dehydrogenase